MPLETLQISGDSRRIANPGHVDFGLELGVGGRKVPLVRLHIGVVVVAEHAVQEAAVIFQVVDVYACVVFEEDPFRKSDEGRRS